MRVAAGGEEPELRIMKNIAAASSAKPIPSCTFRFDQPATMPAPSQAPATAAAIIEISVTTSTGITAM